MITNPSLRSAQQIAMCRPITDGSQADSGGEVSK